MGRAIGVEQREDGLAGPLESGMAEYLVGPEVDRGGFSVIRVAQNKEAKSIVAIKSTLRSLADPSEALSGQADTSECSAQIRREGHLLCRLDHPNIVRCLGIAREGADAHLVLEFLSGGDLANCLKRQGPLREAQARRGARALLSALAHMHRLGVVHRDIKPSNLVMSSSMDLGTLRIVDFGSAVQISARDAAFPREVCGTVGFMAPELTQWPDRSHGLAGRACFPGTNMRVGGVCSTGVDVWSAGVCLYLMLVGRPPFSLGKNPCAARDAYIWSATAETARQFMNGDPWRCAEWMELSEEAKDLILQMMQWRPEDRISAADALESPWFTSEVGLFTQVGRDGLEGPPLGHLTWSLMGRVSGDPNSSVAACVASGRPRRGVHELYGERQARVSISDILQEAALRRVFSGPNNLPPNAG